MGWILMQPSDDAESLTATKILKSTGVCHFELTKVGARLKPIAFGSRSCHDNEVNFHSFTGEAASGRWAIGQNRNYLWGNHFYWMCDCSAVREVLEYDGTIHMICRWAQELLGYDFTCIHRCARMMADVDALTRRFGSLISTHCVIASVLSTQDRLCKPSAYDASTFRSHSTSKLANTVKMSPLVPILSSSLVPLSVCQSTASNSSMPDATTNKLLPQSLKPTSVHHQGSPSIPIHISTSPVMYISQWRPPNPSSSTDSQVLAMRASELCRSLFSEFWCINDICGSAKFWACNDPGLGLRWTQKFIFTNAKYRALFCVLHPDVPTDLAVISSLSPNPDCSIIMITYIKDEVETIFNWFHTIGVLINSAITFSSKFRLGLLWVRADQFPTNVGKACLSITQACLPSEWCMTHFLIDPTVYGDVIEAYRYLIVVTKEVVAIDVSPTSVGCIHDITKAGFFKCLHSFSDYTGIPSAPSVRTSIPFPPHITQHTSNYKAHVIAVFHEDTNTNFDIRNTAAPNYVLDPSYPAMEPSSSEYSNALFGRRFGVPCNTTAVFTARRLSDSELLRCYSIPMLSDNTVFDSNSSLGSCLDDNLRYVAPISSASILISYLIDAVGFTTDIVYGGDNADAHQFYTISASPTAMDWKSAYMNDASTRIMLPMLQQTDKPNWSAEQLNGVEVEYRSFLQDKFIGVLHDKLVYYKPIFRDSRHIALIIVPRLLRRKIFTHYHAGPSGGHMGEYKTLYRIRMRFYWPSMRADIKNWVKSCAHCCAYNVWRNKKSELYFSWPVTTPFYIMHVDLWAPGHLVDKNGATLQAMNSMCDLTQFVVSSLVSDASSSVLAQVFMENVILTFGIVAVVVVDADSKFLGVFKTMCSILKIKFWPLARGNHKGNSVERYHRFLNKTQAIVGQDRGTHDTFKQNIKTSQYAWNSAPIDDTDIPRCLPAVGRIFKFPMDVELESVETLNCSDNSALYIYLRDVSNESSFAQSVLQVLIEERRAAHRVRWNKNRIEQIFQVGNVVKVHVQVQSNSTTGVVKKLSYQARGPFQVIRVLGANSYEVQRYNSKSSAPRKYKGTELYLLPPNLFPCEPMDTMDERYLNSTHAPMVSPLHQPLKIELYNDVYFPPLSTKLEKSNADEPSCLVDTQMITTPLSQSTAVVTMPSTDKLFDDSGNSLPALEYSDIVDYSVIPSALDLDNKLFFVQYNPEDTMRRLWYVIQVDMPSTVTQNPAYASNGLYWCVFHYKHPSDHKLSDACSRWWPEWYRYSRDKVSHDIIYGNRILIRPSVTPNADKFIQWATLLPLYGPQSSVLVGPFDFAPVTASNRIRYKISLCEWSALAQVCNNVDILSPCLTPDKPEQHCSKRKRKRT